MLSKKEKIFWWFSFLLRMFNGIFFCSLSLLALFVLIKDPTAWDFFIVHAFVIVGAWVAFYFLFPQKYSAVSGYIFSPIQGLWSRYKCSQKIQGLFESPFFQFLFFSVFCYLTWTQYKIKNEIFFFWGTWMFAIYAILALIIGLFPRFSEAALNITQKIFVLLLKWAIIIFALILVIWFCYWITLKIDPIPLSIIMGSLIIAYAIKAAK